MKTKIGISGFGRIGRLVARVAVMDPEVELVAINSTADPENTARLFKYDSTHGTFDGEVSFDEGHLIVNGKAIPLFCDRDPNKLDWGKYGTEIVIDSTGAFRTIDTASAHLRDTVKKVIITAPSSDAQMIVMGVNQDAYDPSQPVVSNASCTTNCLAPVTKVIHDNFTIEAAAMTTVRIHE